MAHSIEWTILSVCPTYIYVCGCRTQSDPTEFPCGNCTIEVLDADSALECDECGMWFHIQCQAIGQEAYDDLVATDQSFSWICSNCDHSNFSNSTHSSYVSYASQNNFSILTDEDHHDEHPEPHSSKPSPRIAQYRPVPNKIFKLRVLNINCQSLVNKKAEFHALLNLPNIYVAWSTSELRVRLAPLNLFKPSSKTFYWPFQAVLLLWIFHVFVLSCVCYVFVRVCLYVLWGHLLGKGWPLGSRLWCLLWVCHFPIGILRQVWFLIVSIPDLCTLTYFTQSRYC